MTPAASPSVDPTQRRHATLSSGDADRVAALLAVDPIGLGGVALRARPGPARDAFCRALADRLPEAAPMVRLPLHVTDDRLLGGLSLDATLRTGRAVLQSGLLASADGGVVLAAMAERMDLHVAAQLCAALDRGSITVERDGLTAIAPARLCVLALDEGIDDESPPAVLTERLAFWLTLDDRASVSDVPRGDEVAGARGRLARVVLPSAALEALCRAASVLGIDSLRAPLLAAKAARAHAAWMDRPEVGADDLTVAARLVLGPRATRLPAPREQEEAEPPPPRRSDEQPPSGEDARSSSDAPLDEVVLEAVESGMPPGLLELLAKGARPTRSTAGRAGLGRRSLQSGRPAGVGRFSGRQGERMALVDTLRAAAPWQRLRRGEAATRVDGGRVLVRRDDLKSRRFVLPTESTVIFAVDASGSAAARRLAEAKGAVETVLADCYSRRDHVALVAFRGTEATVVLPPTRSLTRVRRRLAALAGGGTTPLASGIDVALALAARERARGRTPVVVLMTDGRANVARDGCVDSASGAADALQSAASLRDQGMAALLLDTAPRPRRRSRDLADAMGARYLPLPYVDASGIARQVRHLAEEAP